MGLAEDIEQTLAEGRLALDNAATPAELEQARVVFVGRTGRLKDLMSRIKEVPADRKKAVGQRLNEVKAALEAQLAERTRKIGKAARPAGPLPDPTLPPAPSAGGQTQPRGTYHPVTTTTRRFRAIFERLGFGVATGPEIEDRFHNFDALNIPPDHPVREMADTFVLHEDAILRSQTSTVQVRVMREHVARWKAAREAQGPGGAGDDMPDIRVIAPGRVYRPDAVDATHHYGFCQIEGLAVGRAVTFADLKGVLALFAREMFGGGTKTRFRPSFFPFTEPSAELDVSCLFCGGAGCRVCKQTGWVEIGGCGMVDPNVFAAVGIDPERYTGFAFGFGIERMAMFFLGVDDLRRFTENDVRFLRQF